MATLRDIKTRIKGVQNTQQITNAMKMLSHLVTEDDINSNEYLTQRPVKNVAVVIISADRGLCGAFNTNLIKDAVRYIKDELNPENIGAHLFCIGKKGYDYFNKRNYNLAGKRLGLFSSLEYGQVLSISEELIKGYQDGKFDKIVIIYNEFKSIIHQKIVVGQFLPIPLDQNKEEESTKVVDYIFEPGQNAIFRFLLPKHLKAQIWRILLESNAAELGSRMTAMDNATTNAKELIRTLKIKYNSERQAAITKEILEIVSGANALKAN